MLAKSRPNPGWESLWQQDRRRPSPNGYDTRYELHGSARVGRQHAPPRQHGESNHPPSSARTSSFFYYRTSTAPGQLIHSVVSHQVGRTGPVKLDCHLRDWSRPRGRGRAGGGRVRGYRDVSGLQDHCVLYLVFHCSHVERIVRAKLLAKYSSWPSRKGWPDTNSRCRSMPKPLAARPRREISRIAR
jgi:hypothetical protein